MGRPTSRTLSLGALFLAGVVAVHGRPRPEWLVGPEAERLWAESPMWYDRKIWGSLALWERKAVAPPIQR